MRASHPLEGRRTPSGYEQLTPCKTPTRRFEESASESTRYHTSKRVIFTPNRVHGGVDSIVSQSCRAGAEQETKRNAMGWIIPKTPAELPKNVPLRVTELRTLLIRSRAIDTASGLLAPSRKPPRASPIGGQGMWSVQYNKMC